MDKNYLIIGGSGFIGTHYIRYVKDKQPQSRFINIDFKEEEKTLSDKYIDWDIRKPIPVENVGTDKIDAIVNLAALAKIPGYEKHEYFETNVLDAKHGCQLAREKGIDTILFTSTMSTFGPDEHEKKRNYASDACRPLWCIKSTRGIHQQTMAIGGSRKKNLDYYSPWSSVRYRRKW